MIRSQKKQAMEDLSSFSAGDLTLWAVSPDALGRGMESTREGVGLLELNGTNLLAVGLKDILGVLVVGEKPVGAEQENFVCRSIPSEAEFFKTVGGASRSLFAVFLLAPAALPKSNSNKAKSPLSSSRSSAAMVTLP